jgi:hypothetical protein
LVPNGDAVQLITGPPGGSLGCFLNHASGRLVVDPKYGTAIVDNDVRGSTPMTVAWRPGFTARHVGSEVEVLDAQGNSVAITGRSYMVPGGLVSAGGSSGLVWPELRILVFWACDSVTPLA